MQELSLESFISDEKPVKKKVWYIALIWRPNAGKSTFLNTLLKEKVSIVSSVPQTTRKKVLWIYNDPDSQIIFFDTPWIHQSQKQFNQSINSVSMSTFADAQVILYFIDLSREKWDEETYIESLLQTVSTPIIKVYTKSDLPPRIKWDWEGSFTISSLQNQGLEELLQAIKKYLPLEYPLYPDEFYTTQDLSFRISEIVREKVFLSTSEELPHSIYVSVEEVEETEKMYRIIAYIIAETESQKYILIGKQGSLLTKIGKEARIDLERILDKKVFLALRIKVQKNWRKDEKLVKDILN